MILLKLLKKNNPFLRSDREHRFRNASIASRAGCSSCDSFSFPTSISEGRSSPGL